ncbi:MAG: ornithine carbamoyltransferase [Acidimicrobiia bacterium]|nr:ornithine carbamoyltransferase [Acidimicrobiia bacterium]
MTDFLMVTDLGRDGLAETLRLAADSKRNLAAYDGAMAGKKVGLFFEKPSTRTRVSCEVATVELGAHPVVLKSDEVGLGKREAVEDVGRVLDRYLDVLAFRVFAHGNLEKMAPLTTAPVINLLSDRSHPCQALADLQTIAEHKPLEEAKVAYIGDGNNVCHSLMLAGAMTGVDVRVAGPEGYQPAADITARAREIAAKTGGAITVTTSAAEAIGGADVVYTDVWTSMGQEAEATERIEMLMPYQVTMDLFAGAAADAIFMHCLPAHRGEEATHDVLEHARSRIFDQAENRMHSFRGLLLYLNG